MKNHIILRAYILMSVLFFSANLLFSQNSFYGMTSEGGQQNLGLIYKTDVNGENLVVDYEFTGILSACPDQIQLCEFTDGNLYGMSALGSDILCITPVLASMNRKSNLII
jgi:uncharacterized repeat protein (TIGR03803 family)